jgi:hypothetical protein
MKTTGKQPIAAMTEMAPRVNPDFKSGSVHPCISAKEEREILRQFEAYVASFLAGTGQRVAATGKDDAA